MLEMSIAFGHKCGQANIATTTKTLTSKNLTNKIFLLINSFNLVLSLNK